MEIPNNFNYKASVPDISNVVRFSGFDIASKLNCVRIASVEEVHYDDLTVTVRLLNKKTLGLNKDGTPNVSDYPLIRAKICFCNPFITSPINKGDECILLFSDREIESWFINGEANPLAYQRMHDITDAFAIFGIRSLPNMIQILQDALHQFFFGSDIQLGAGEIILNSPMVTINSTSGITLNSPSVSTTGNLSVGTGYSGVIPCGAVTVQVTDGIITGVS